jgi:replicative DNA helicase
VHYADLVREHARRRQCVVIAEQLRAEALAADDLEESRARAEHALRDLDAGQAAAFTSIARAAHAGLDDLEAIAQAEDGVTGVPTGFATVDRMLGGLQGGDLVVLAARPSVGKTAAACQMAMHAALIRHVPTLFVTLEQRASQLTLRMASNAARVDLVALRVGQATEEESARLHQAAARLSEAPITFIDARDVRMSDVRRHARLLRAQGKCSLIVLDYLTLLEPERTSTRGETREAQVAAQSRLAKSIARELGVPFVLLSQLNREFEKDAGARKGSRKPRRPRLSDLRESGAIEQDADVVVFVHRPYVRPEGLEERTREGETELIVSKNRNGPTGLVRAHYAKTWVRFTETTSEPGGQ